MPKNGYGTVDDKGYVSFGGALEEGAWKDISIKKYDSDEMLALSPLSATPIAVGWKLAGIWGIRSLVKAMSVGNGVELDQEWDSAQRSFAAGVASEEDHQDAAHRAAAGRIRTSLLDGAGTSQTQLDLDREYDFGMKQLRLAEEKSLGADLKLTGLAPKLERIREATAALGQGTGRGPGKNRAPSRSLQIRDALQQCSATFNRIHDELVWAIDHTASRSGRHSLFGGSSCPQGWRRRASRCNGAPPRACASRTTTFVASARRFRVGFPRGVVASRSPRAARAPNGLNPRETAGS